MSSVLTLSVVNALDEYEYTDIPNPGSKFKSGGFSVERSFPYVRKWT